MKIAMLARNANLYSHQRLVEAALARGHEIDILNTLRVTMKSDPDVLATKATAASSKSVMASVRASSQAA